MAKQVRKNLTENFQAWSTKIFAIIEKWIFLPDQLSSKVEKKIENTIFQPSEVRKLIGYIDLTTLAGDDTKDRVEALVDRAINPVPQVGFFVKLAFLQSFKRGKFKEKNPSFLLVYLVFSKFQI